MRRNSATPIASSFLQKTFEMLSDDSLSDTISWTPSGESFELRNLTEFSEQVLPKYFKHNNLASFVRQLNMYDFHKQRKGGSSQVFSHPLFMKGRPELLKSINRKTPESNLQLVPVSNFSKSETGHLITKLYKLHKKSESNDARIKQLEDSVKVLTSQNKNLLSQFWETCQRTQRIESILMLVASYMKENRQDLSSHLVRDRLLSITHGDNELEFTSSTIDQDFHSDEAIESRFDIGSDDEDAIDLLLE